MAKSFKSVPSFYRHYKELILGKPILEGIRRKLSSIYVPKLVVERFPNNTCTLKDLFSGKTTERPVHVSHLKYLDKFNPALYLATETQQLGDKFLKHLIDVE